MRAVCLAILCLFSAVTGSLALGAFHWFERWGCHAYLCDVYHCTDSPQAPSQDQLQFAANDYMYTSLGNDCGSMTTIPLIKPVLTDADIPKPAQVYCPSGNGLWLSTYRFEIWRSPDQYAVGDHVANWNGTRFHGATMFKATCNVDNGFVDCKRGDKTCKALHAPPNGIVPP